MANEELIKYLAEKGLFDEKSDSISISRGMAGKYSYDAKIYSKDIFAPGEAEKVINRLEEINKILAAKFPNGV